MKNNKISVSLLALLSFILFLSGAVLGYLLPRNTLENNIAELNEIVENNFDGDYDFSTINNAVLKAYVDSLDDDYAQFISKEEVNEYNLSYEGMSNGIGINYILNDDGNILVCFVHQNSPADKANIKKGDIITNIDDLVVSKLKRAEIIDYLTSIKKEQVVELVVLRDNKNLNLSVTYSDYAKQTVIYEQHDNIGYIKFTHFETYTVTQFNDALEALIKNNVKALIFDVRDNGGGLVSSATKILDKLLPKCDIISVKYKSGKEKVIQSDASFINLPMCVLTNGNSASASELFAQALKEKCNAKIFGEKTFGKGVMQTTFKLSDGSCVKFTVGKFYSPNKKNWDKIGITPDIEVKLTKEELENYYFLTFNTDSVIKAANSYLTNILK